MSDAKQKTDRKLLEECRVLLEQREAELALLRDQISQSEIYEKNYIDTNETAKVLGVRPRTVRAYNYDGKLTGRRYSKEGRLYFPLKQVLAFREARLKHWAAFE